jgi:hypothetical protein
MQATRFDNFDHLETRHKHNRIWQPQPCQNIDFAVTVTVIALSHTIYFGVTYAGMTRLHQQYMQSNQSHSKMLLAANEARSGRSHMPSRTLVRLASQTSKDLHGSSLANNSNLEI